MGSKVEAILLMGGEGARFNSSLPKQFHPLGGKPLFIHTLETFVKSGLFDRIVLVIPIRWQETTSIYVSRFLPGENIVQVLGGRSRQESSRAGILACSEDTDYVLIHDAVRPFVTQKILEENIRQVRLHGAVDTCIPSTDTPVRSGDGSRIDEIPDRKEFFRGQTPQTFSFHLIKECHATAPGEGLTEMSDDCSLVKFFGHSVKIVQGSERNIKITTELDLLLAERILQHALEEEERATPVEETPLKGRIFAVTGATGGIGATLCRKLRELGALPLEISKTSPEFKADLTKWEEVERTFLAIHERYGTIDGLINSVGTFQVKELHDLSEADIQETIASNLTSVIYCCRSGKIKKGGHIVNIASSSYTRGRKEYPVYSAAKAAVVNFTQALAEGYPDLRVNVIAPQRTDTPLRRKNFPDESPSSLLSPEEIASSVAAILYGPNVSGTIREVRKKHS